MKKNKIIIEYVQSGALLAFRLNNPNEDFRREVSRNLKTSSQYLQDKFNNGVQIASLFNAYTEETIVDRCGHDFRDLFTNDNYADSGGLQILTRGGIQIDDEMKQRIYSIQAKYAEFAFSFDELPFKMRGGNRVYLGDEVAGEYGTKAGKNIAEQLKYFKKINSNVSTFAISQGPTFQGMSNYTLNMLGELEKNQLDRLDCVASGGLIWTNEFGILERIVNLYKLDGIPPKMLQHVHLLGVTGLRKLTPTLIFTKNNLFDGLKRLSFDSTKITKSYMNGNISPSLAEMKVGLPERKIGKVRNAEVEAYYEEMFNWWKDNPHNIFDSADDLIESSLYNSRGFHTETQQFWGLGLESGVKTAVQIMVWVYYNTFKFLEVVEAYWNSEIKLCDFMGRYPRLHFLEELETITDISEYEAWYKDVRYLVETEQKPVEDWRHIISDLF